MENTRRLVVTVLVLVFALAGGALGEGKPDAFLSSARPLYEAGEFDTALAFCQGVDTFEADLIGYLCSLEQYARAHQRADRDRAERYKARLESEDVLAHAPAIASLAAMHDHRRGSRAALGLLEDAITTAHTADEIRRLVELLDPRLGVDVNRLALRSVYKHLSSVRNRIRRGGTMTPAEKRLFSDPALLESLVTLLDDSRMAWVAENSLVQIQEPALQRLSMSAASGRRAHAIAKVDRVIQWRAARRASSTWFSAYGEDPAATTAETGMAAARVDTTEGGVGVGAMPGGGAVAGVELSTDEMPGGMAFGPPGRRYLSGGLGALAGDSTYRIGGNVQYGDGSSTQFHFPISELVFPLDVVMIELRGGVALSDDWTITAQLDKSLTTDAGSMQDSDWVSPGVLTIYSESDTELDAVVLDARLDRRVSVRDRLGFAVGGGLRYESFSFDCANTVQRSILGGYSASHAGLALTYDVSYVMPFLSVTADYEMSDTLRLSAVLAYAPFILVEDSDAHLARSPQKFSDGSYDGSAVLFRLGARLLLQGGWFVDGQIDSVSIQADGDQEVRSGSSTWTIDAEIESSQTMLSVAVGRFL